ncbi:MAG: metallophosphoesterase [Nanoarchaeota archaeon]
MKILAIGDPHGDLDKIKRIPIKNIDLILLTGDLGSADLIRKMAFENIDRQKQGLDKKEFLSSMKKKGYLEVYNSSLKVVKYLANLAPVFLIYGNADEHNQEVRTLSKEIKQKLPFMYTDLTNMNNVKIINNKIANFNGVRIGGLEYFVDTCWIKEFKPTDYAKKMKQAKKESDKAKKVLGKYEDIDILLCHQPPYGVLDKVSFKGAPKFWIGKHAGSKIILDYLKKKHPQYVFCGHIHEAEGIKKLGKTEIYNLGVAGYKIVSIK